MNRAEVLCLSFTVAGFCLIIPDVSRNSSINDWTLTGLGCLLIASVLAALIFHTQLKNVPNERSPK